MRIEANGSVDQICGDVELHNNIKFNLSDQLENPDCFLRESDELNREAVLVHSFNTSIGFLSVVFIFRDEHPGDFYLSEEIYNFLVKNKRIVYNESGDQGCIEIDLKNKKYIAKVVPIKKHNYIGLKLLKELNPIITTVDPYTKQVITSFKMFSTDETATQTTNNNTISPIVQITFEHLPLCF